ncbi:MAG TPA: porin [Vicinamibacteria bacterium]|nr:porin [Vicinamibacteria bacterium]
MLVVVLALARVAAADEGQDKPQPAPSPSPSASPSPSPSPAPALIGRGGSGHVLWEGESGSVALLNRVQVRWTDEMPDDRLQLPGTEGPGSSKGSFRIRRAKTELTGWVWRRELTYELQLSWAGAEPGTSTTSPLEDFILNWDASKNQRFQIAVGQFKVPLGRQEMTSSNRLEFADRDLLSGEFSRGRDVGVQLWGLLGKGKVEYRAGIFNGNPAARPENDNDKYQFNARLMFQPFGDARYSESDFESRSGKPLLAVAGQYERNNQHGSTNIDDLDTRIFGLDAVFKYHGLFLFAEYFARHRTPETSPEFDSNGFHAQAGYFLIRDRLEVAARWAGYDPSDLIPDNDRKEVGGVVNYYFNRHNLKLQADFRQIDDDGRETKNQELRVQAQVVF